MRVVGAAEAAAEQARMDVYASAGQGTLLALAVREAAGSLPDVQNLTITPDLLTGVLGSLLGGALGVPDGGPGAPRPGGTTGGTRSGATAGTTGKAV